MKTTAAISEELQEPTEKLLKAAGLPGDFQLFPLTGGANNRVFRVAQGAGQAALLKVYCQHPDDPRDRLGAEFAFSSFAWEKGVRWLPRPLACDRANGLGLYEFVEGIAVGPNEVTQERVEQALQFFLELNRHRESPEARALPAASEACFSIQDHLRRVESRLRALRVLEVTDAIGQAAVLFIREELLPLWDRVRTSVLEQVRELRLVLDEEIPAQDRRLSPSDFGFHNALVMKDGRLRFIDFEYAGWDDPVKAACDFFCLQGVKVPEIYFEAFARGMVGDLSDPKACFERAKILQSVHRVKWCCILLNDFLPVGSQRRRFSDQAASRTDQEAIQLRKARSALHELRQRCAAGPSFSFLSHETRRSAPFVVIGSNCFTGSHFVNGLLEDPRNRVVGVSRSAQKGSLYLPYKARQTKNFQFHQVDIVRQSQRLQMLLDELQPAVVIHVAALSEVALSTMRPLDYFQTNTLSLVTLCDFLRTRSYLKRFIYISSAEVYGSCDKPVTESAPLRPSTPYAVSKAAADMFLATLSKNFNFPVVTVRSTNVYGRHQQLFKIIPRTIISIKQGKKIQLYGGGQAIKSFVHIRDVVRGALEAVRVGKPGSVYHFSDGKDLTVADVAGRIAQRMGCRFEEVTEPAQKRLGEDFRYNLDCTTSKVELGWEPQISFDDGLQEVIDWIEASWEEIAGEPLVYVHRA